mmetsp:Transcript_8780/g.13549  ORF Transcript_8780/g.13549 Transcript_8780/m.13549 type:complete len:243 (-) Transcript_8780:19-747(-)
MEDRRSRSSRLLSGSLGGEGGDLRVGIGQNLVVVEAGHRGLDVVSLSHIEVLSEVLISAPPVGMNHTNLLILPDLVEVRVSDIVLLSIGGESAVGVRGVVEGVSLSNVPLPLSNHALLLHLGDEVQDERLVEVVEEQAPHNSDPVLAGQSRDLPEGVSPGVLKEPGDVLEHSPLLGHITRLLGSNHELSEVAVGFLGEGSANHVSSLVHVRVSVHEALNTGEALSEVGLGMVPIVQVLSHVN